MFANQFEDLAPPLPGQVFLVAHSATAARFEIPPQWRGKIITFTSSGSDLYVLLGSANSMIESAEVAVAVSEKLAPNWASGALVPAGASIPVPVPISPSITHFTVDSSGTSGQWCAYVSSGNPGFGESLPDDLGQPILWLDAGRRASLAVDAGAVTVAGWKSRHATGYEFAEASTKPDLLTAAGAGSGLLRAAVEFITGSSEKLVSNDATLAAALGSNNPFTLWINFRRGATGAAHTLFSVSTASSANGFWNVTLDASDDIVVTRKTAAGASTTSVYAATISGAYSLLLTYDGTTLLAWLDGTSISLTGLAAGDIGTPTKVAIGARHINVTTDQYANAQICDVLAYSSCFSGASLAILQDWARRRSGK